MTRWPAAFVFAVLCVCASGRALHAQATPATPSAGSQWQFNDEDEQAPTWTEMVRSQAVDLAVFTGFTALALVSFFRKDKPLKYVTLAACVVLLGFWKSQLITVVNVFGLISLDLPIFRYSLAWYLLATFTIVSTVLWGRLYCGRMCAFGALTQLMDATLPASWRREPPAWLEQRAMYIKYGVLAFAILYFLVTRDRLIYRYIEPFWMFGFHGSVVMWTLLVALLVATVFVRNLYCRFLCPVGAALGAISSVTTIFSIKRWKECNTCKICEKACEWGAIRGPKIVKSECVRCDDCERIYADEAKCVHWLVLKKKSDFARAKS
jgi:NosR/NirI family transcriptional regulator, nitrous oxide reductase regulator